MSGAHFSVQVAGSATGVVETNGLQEYQEFFQLDVPATSVTITVNGGVLPTNLAAIQVYDNGTPVFPSTGATIRDWTLTAPGTINFVESVLGVETPVELSDQITIKFWA